MERTRAHLETLIGVCLDGHRGYRTAAEFAGSMEMKRLFGLLADEREQFGEQLARKLGAAPHARGSIPGALHRGWMEIHGMSQAELLRECVRGETAAIRQYERVLGKDVRTDVRELVATQLARILETHDRLTQLADAR